MQGLFLNSHDYFDGIFEHVYDLVKDDKICYIKEGRNIGFRPEDFKKLPKGFMKRHEALEDNYLGRHRVK